MICLIFAEYSYSGFVVLDISDMLKKNLWLQNMHVFFFNFIHMHKYLEQIVGIKVLLHE